MAVPKKRRSRKKSNFLKNNWIQKTKKFIYNSYSLGISEIKKKLK